MSWSSVLDGCGTCLRDYRRYLPDYSLDRQLALADVRCGSKADIPETTQSSVSTFTIRWSWLLPTQKVTGVVELSTNTVRMLVSTGIRYCTEWPVLGSSRTTRSVNIVEAQISPFLS